MGIFDRMGRVISSNFNSLIDKLEDPKKSIDHTIDEMHEQLRAARQEIVAAVAAEKQLKAKVETLDAEARKWEDRAELALRKGDEALAREALTHKNRVVAERDRAEAVRAEQRGAALEMKAELERMDQKVKEIAARRSTIAAQVQQARAGGGPEGLGRTGPGPTPFDELRRMEDQIEGVEASVQAQRELDQALGLRGLSGLSHAEVEAKFRALEAEGASAKSSSDVDAELDRLKQRIRIKE
jgi:phage shock protein A